VNARVDGEPNVLGHFGALVPGHSQARLNTVARELNTRPRQTLSWMTPSQKLAEAVAKTG
jgi:IS30 family transposase